MKENLPKYNDVKLLPMVQEFSIIDTNNTFFILNCDGIVIPKNSSRRLRCSFFKFVNLCNDTFNSKLNIFLENEKNNCLNFSLNESVRAYNIKATNEQININAIDEAHLFYALQTLKQLLVNYNGAIPSLKISDHSDYEVRGFYHDITRGKVPKLETLFELVDKLASYKINQLQLYVEYTHQFENHIDLWGGSDALSNEDILKLDQYCYDNFIELVPSLSCFGHMYKALKSHRKEHLNELNVKGSDYAFSQRDRMWHYTLDANNNQEVIELVTELITEYSQLFRSDKFNICCDETFDLGTDKNKKCSDKGKLYVDYLNKIIAHVFGLNKTPMLWGDVIINYPDLIKEIPKDVIFLNWDYSADGKERPCEVFAKNNCNYYACPSVQGWNQFISNIQLSTDNISNLATIGLENNAQGLLTTDWGDYCHINSLSASFYGLALGAAKGWNSAQEFSVENFMSLEYDINNNKIAMQLFELMKTAGLLPKRLFWTWCDLFTGSVDYPQPYRVLPTLIPEAIKERLNLAEIANDYQNALKLYSEALPLITQIKITNQNRTVVNELLHGFKGTLVMLETMYGIAAVAHDINGIASVKLPAKYKIADNLRSFENDFSQIWHRRNRPSEYYIIKTLFLDTADFLERSDLI